MIEQAQAKTCNGCKNEQPLSEFYPAPNTRCLYGVGGQCKRCISKKNKERAALRTQEQIERKRDYMRWLHISRNYGISRDEYVSLLAAQGGACAICRSPDFRGRTPCVDHDHETGAVRGILCDRCNTGLGYFDDVEAGIAQALDYLRRAS